jgi:small-conductance mechanosensitive channel
MRIAELYELYPWLTIAVVCTIVVLVALLAHRILLVLLRRLARFSTMLSAVVEETAAPAQFALPLLLVQFVMVATPVHLPFRAAALHVLALMLLAAFTWLAIRAVNGVGETLIRLHPGSADDNDLEGRRIRTQTRVLTRTVKFLIFLIGAASALMSFPDMRHVGASLLASAGVVGVVAGIAARPVFGNLIAGLQIALTQPLRLDDVVIIENEWGIVEEINATYIVVKIWDERRLVVPLEYVIQKPFQNWTRTGSQLLGTVFLWLDYRTPIAPLRAELERVCQAAPEWDGRIAMIQMTDSNERAVQVRALVSAADAGKAWDLRCRVRETLVDYLQREWPDALPRLRAEVIAAAGDVVAEESGTPLREPRGESMPMSELRGAVRASPDPGAASRHPVDVTARGGDG